MTKKAKPDEPLECTCPIGEEDPACPEHQRLERKERNVIHTTMGTNDYDPDAKR